MAVRQISRRWRQFARILQTEGTRGISSRVRRGVSKRLMERNIDWEVMPQDLVAADLANPFAPAALPLGGTEPIRVNWVVEPPGPYSGGHTTLFRTIRYLEAQGYLNRIYFYDPYRGDHDYYKQIARDYHNVTCPIDNISDGLTDAHALVATAWQTAYPVFNARSAGERFYFVQDYEPYFYPMGSNTVFAENTYRMGFHGITAGRWLAEKLRAEFGMSADHFPFGCDTNKYRPQPGSSRSGIAFYARVGNTRRGVELGLLALELFARRQPDCDIHFYGERIDDLPFKRINHGLVSPTQLNEIYNRSFAGLSLSLTNVSLVPHEMLSAGCIPVVNEAEHNRIVLDNPHVRYAEATPQALAAALEDIVTAPNFADLSRRGAESVVPISWDDAGAAVDDIFQRTLRGKVGLC
jgi:O-antigen biosynthesis protein